MALNHEHYSGLWRGSANEGMPYTDDFPEPLLVLPELWDGALGEGKATIIHTTVDITNPEKCILTLEDNGIGLVKESRFTRWMAPQGAGENHATESVYSHGSKKCITKWAPEYDKADWRVSWRKRDKRGLATGTLHFLKSPFLGPDTFRDEGIDEEDDKICKGGGTKWEVEFNIKVLHNINTAIKLNNAIHEIIRTRFTQEAFDRCEMKTTIKDGEHIIEKTSNEFCSLAQCLKDICDRGEYVDELYNFTVSSESENTTANVVFYKIRGDGRKNKIDGLPTFGRKNMTSTRVHLARNDRYIEAKPYHRWAEKEKHNSNNGIIGFIKFTSDTNILPTPSTTKVALREECPIYREMHSKIKHTMKILDNEKKKQKKEAKNQLMTQKTLATTISSNEDIPSYIGSTDNIVCDDLHTSQTASDGVISRQQEQEVVPGRSVEIKAPSTVTAMEDNSNKVTLEVASTDTIEQNNDIQKKNALETASHTNNDEQIYSKNDIEAICTHFKISYNDVKAFLSRRD